MMMQLNSRLITRQLILRLILRLIRLMGFMIVGVCVLAIQNCRIANVGKSSGGDNQPAKSTSPASDPNATNATVTLPAPQSTPGAVLPVTLDASGKVTDSLTLRLDYFPAPRTDGLSSPTCSSAINGNTVIGRLFCSANGNIAMDLTASQIDQECYTASPPQKTPAKSSVTLVGCQNAAELHAIKFDPDLKIEVSKN